MKQRLTRIVATVAAIGLAQVQAGPVTVEPKAPKEAVQIAPVSQSRWSIGAGAVVREIEGGFNMRSPGRLSTRGLFRSPSGRGDVGFFTGGSGTVQYDDGQAGPEGIFVVPLIAQSKGIINTPSQVTATGRSYTIPVPVNTIIYDVSFHTTGTEYTYASHYSPRKFHSTDEETGVGPYLELRYAAFKGERAAVNVVFGYSWVSVDLASGTGLLATQSITETRDHRRFTYGYDLIQLQGAVQTSSYPLDLSTVDAGLIYDADPINAFFPGSQFQDPRKRVDRSRSSRTVAEFVAIGSASLDIDLHELVLAPEVSCDLGQRLHLGVSVGPTVNFVNTDLDAQAAWYRRGSSEAIKTYHASDSGTEVKLGVAAQLSVVFDLTESLFLQASGSYRWVDDFDVEAGFAKANVDLSAWQGALGLGIRL